MLHLYDRASMARALTLDLDPKLRALLADRIAGLATGEFDLSDHTEFLVVQPGDTEADIVRHVGFSPLVDPVDGLRFPAPGYQPPYEWLGYNGCLIMIAYLASAARGCLNRMP